MSHRPERKEKDCLNCGAEVYGKYCHVCGQENIVAKESFWNLVTHFVYDVTHFDGKFFSTLKLLLLKPGFLSVEYSKGRRASYLHPIRMYVFTSAFFFLFFFSIFNAENSIKISSSEAKTAEQAKTNVEKRKKALQSTVKDSSTPAFARDLITKEIIRLDQDLETLKTDTNHLKDLNYNNSARFTMIGQNTYFRTTSEYDSIQRILPEKERDGWIIRQFRHKEIHIKEKYGNDKRALINALINKFLHLFPQMLFVSLPIFALLLSLLYVRRSTQFYYADHTIYAIHLYCGMFVLLFLQICFSKLSNVHYLGWVKYISIGTIIYMFYYVYKSMRNFYRQRRLKTIFKFLLLLILSSIMMSLLFSFFFIFSVFTV